MRFHRILRLTLAALLVSVAAGCATESALKEARTQFDAGQGEEALAVLDKAMKQHPENLDLRTEYFKMREILVRQWLAQAESMRLAGQLDVASALYRRVQRIDSANARAKAGLEQVKAGLRHRDIVGTAEKLVKAGKYLDAQDLLRPVLMEDPGQRDARRLQRIIDDRLVRPAYAQVRLKATTTKPISLELRDVSLRAVFDVLSHASGVTFILDKDVQADQKTTLVVRNATVEDAMRMVLLANQLGDELLNETTVLVYPDTPVKRREHQELVVRTFYLANADAKDTANMVRAVVKTRDIFIDEKRNLLMVRDTPKAVRLIDKLIATQDLAEPEVMLEVEVLEIGTNRLRQLGMRFPDSLAWSLVGGGAANPSGTPGVLTLPEWLNRNASLVRLTFTDPLFLLSLMQQDTSTKLLANPSVRVKNKEKANIHIGERVPVITTTASATAGFISENVSYLDVGLKLDVEPIIHLDDEVDIKLALEVSNILGTVTGTTTGTSGSAQTLAYQIGTRNASTTLRLRDGETQILAGLISDEDRQTASRVPGVGDLPVLGRLFSSTDETKTRTEIVLLITPRLVRTLARPGADAVEFAAGTEASSGAAQVTTRVVPQQARPQAPAGAPTPPPPAPSGPSIVPFGGMQRSTP